MRYQSSDEAIEAALQRTNPGLDEEDDLPAEVLQERDEEARLESQHQADLLALFRAGRL